jgi:two-component system chemotaxis response regulator CheB
VIKVLVVEDSPVAREYLVHILNSEGGIEVIGIANNGMEAVEMVGRLRPNVVTMDINMPVMDGLDATRRIMETNPVPIVIVSGVWDPKEVETTFKAMEAGALAIVQRPVGIGHPDAGNMAKEVVLQVKLMSEVKVVRRRGRYGQDAQKADTPGPAYEAVPLKSSEDKTVVAIGASAGGPVVIRTILDALPKDFPASILIVQHIAAGFLKGMVQWLAETSGVAVKIAEKGERLLPGHAYLAPDSFHLGVDGNSRIYLDSGDTKNSPVPSVAYLFRSVAESFGRKAIGILLTGMGSDGAAELKFMKDRGAVTIAQDKESSVIYGMPGLAVDLGAATYVLSPERITAALRALTKRDRHMREDRDAR